MPPTSKSSVCSRALAACVPALLLLLACSSNDSNGVGGTASPAGSIGGSGGAHAGAGAGPGSGTGSPSDALTGSCSPAGSTHKCCGTGTQTCIPDGLGEFAMWGPCEDKGGDLLDCDVGGPVCGESEFGPACDAGTPEDAGEPPPPPPDCDDEDINNEPEILAAYLPEDGDSVSQCGDIKVWVNDEWASFIAPGEEVDPSTGEVTKPGDRTKLAPDGYLYEPALYIENMPPIFPTFIKGWYNNDPENFERNKSNPPGAEGPPIDDPPPGTDLSEDFTTEFVWNLCSLNLPDRKSVV